MDRWELRWNLLLKSFLLTKVESYGILSCDNGGRISLNDWVIAE
jgi:hypothetical protein